MKKNVIFLLLIVLITSTPLFGNGTKDNSEGKLKVITTLFPLYDFTKQIGGDKVHVTLLLRPGVEAHSFEPTPQDMVQIDRGDLFIYTSDLMEPWARDLTGRDTQSGLLVVNTSLSVPQEVLELHTDDHEDEDEIHHEEEGHDHESNDPHIWTDPIIAKYMVEAIVKGLTEIDPENSDYYINNGNVLKDKLQDLHEKIEKTLKRCSKKTIMYGGHFNFGYFVYRHGLSAISPYPGFSPNTEPTPTKIAELIEIIKKQNIKAIYYGELIEPRVAKIIAEETGARMLLLHGAHNLSKKEFESGITYVDIMINNINNLKIGLEYK